MPPQSVLALTVWQRFVSHKQFACQKGKSNHKTKRSVLI